MILSLSENGEVLWRVKGNGWNQRLIVQWNEVEYANSTGGTEFINVQAILYQADGSIRINFQNLDTGSTSDGGASATIGIKDAGTGTDSDVLLVSKNSGPNWFVGNDTSIWINNTSMWSYTASGSVVNNVDVLMKDDDTLQVLIDGTEFLFDQGGPTSQISVDLGAGVDDLDIVLAATANDEFDLLFDRHAFRLTDNLGNVIRTQGSEDQRATGDESDSAWFVDGSSSDQFVGREGVSIMQETAGPEYYNRANGVGEISVDLSTKGGIDIARIFDSIGDDVFTFDPTSASINYQSGQSIEVLGGTQVNGKATGGGIDEAHFTGSSNNDVLNASTSSVQLRAPGYRNLITDQFELVTVDASGLGDDRASVRDSANDEHLDAKIGEFANFTGGAYELRTNGFEKFTVNATQGGNDTASIEGLDSANAFRHFNDDSKFSNQETASFVNVRKFELVDAFGGSDDRAFLNGSSGDDHLDQSGNLLTFTSNDRVSRVSGFGEFVVTGRGGNDSATYGGTENDDFLKSYWNRLIFESSIFILNVKDFSDTTILDSLGEDTIDIFDSREDADELVVAIDSTDDGMMTYSTGSTVSFVGVDTLNARASYGGDDDKIDYLNGETFTINVFSGWELEV